MITVSKASLAVLLRPRAFIVPFLVALTAAIFADEPERPINPMLTERMSGPAELTEKLRRATVLLAKSDLGEALKLTQAVIEAPEASAEQKGNAQYGRGAALLKQREFDAAMAAFAAVSEMKTIPAELTALSHWAQARVNMEQNRVEPALKCLASAVAVQDAPSHVTANILNTRAAILDGLGRKDEALADYKLIAAQGSLPPVIRAKALLRRAESRRDSGDRDRALQDYSTVINLKPAPPPEALAHALIDRSQIYLSMRRLPEAEADTTRLIEEKPPVAPNWRWVAQFNRATARQQAGNVPGATEDFREVLKVSNLPTKEGTLTRIHLGTLLADHGTLEEGLGLLNSVIGNDLAPAALVGHASAVRGRIFAQGNKMPQALEDLTRAILIPTTPKDQHAQARLNRGTIHLQAGRRDEAVHDIQSVIQDKEAQPDQRAQAWHRMAIVDRDSGNVEAAIGDVDRALAIEGITPERRATLLRQRVLLQESKKRYSEAVTDMSEVMKLPRSLDNQMLDLLYRAQILSKAKRYEEMVADLTHVIEAREAPMKFVKEALRLRGDYYKAAGEAEKSQADLARREQLPAQ
jgi:tetratricopeptide (TPR) repeat protein